MAFGMNIAKTLFRSAPEPEAEIIAPNAEQEMFDVKKELLEVARSIAGDRKPTLEDYRLASQAFAKDSLPDDIIAQNPALAQAVAQNPQLHAQIQSMAANGQWNPSIAADLSGQTISGFKINEPDTGVMTQLLDLDGDGAVNDFYATMKFQNTIIEHSEFHPATSFNHQIADAAKLDNITFDGMSAKNKENEPDSFTFGSGQYSNITMKNVTGGELVFSEGVRVNGLDITGIRASIGMGKNATVENMNVDKNTSILTFQMEPGATIKNSDLREATISMSSTLKGVNLQGVKFSGNLANVDLSGAKLQNVTLENIGKGQLDGLELNGASIANLKINGQAITNPQQLKAYGIMADNNTRIAASPEFVKQAEQEQKSAKLQEAMAQVKDMGKILLEATAMVDGSMGQYQAMNKDMAKTPVEQKQDPLQNQIAANGEGKQAQQPERSGPAKQNSGQSTGDLMSYYAKMSASNGRSL